jgi:hypothetical protein
MSRESPRFLTLGEQRVFAAGEAIYAVKLKHVFACREMKRRSRVRLQRSGAL